MSAVGPKLSDRSYRCKLSVDFDLLSGKFYFSCDQCYTSKFHPNYHLSQAHSQWKSHLRVPSYQAFSKIADVSFSFILQDPTLLFFRSLKHSDMSDIFWDLYGGDVAEHYEF